MKLKMFFAFAVALMCLPLVAAKDKGSAQPDPAGLVWPPPPAPARIKWVQEIRNEFDIGAKKKNSFISKLAGKSEDVLWINKPFSVAFDPQGSLYVGDCNQGVIKFDLVNKKVVNFSRSSGQMIADATGVAADSEMVYATSATKDSLSVFDKNGTYLKGLTKSNGLNHPVGVAVDEEKNLVILVNGGDHEILFFDRQLKFLRKIGKRGSGPGEFNFPTYVTVIRGKGFAVTDTGNFRIQMFDYSGKFKGQFGKAGDSTGKFARPKGIACSPDGHLYIADGLFDNFQVFRQDGQLLTFVGGPGRTFGRFSCPVGIAISEDGTIAVADQLNRRIQIFKYLGNGESDQTEEPAK